MGALRRPGSLDSLILGGLMYRLFEYELEDEGEVYIETDR